MARVLRRIGMQILWHLHRLAYRVSGGRAAGQRTLALHTIGRRSGEPRMTMLTYFSFSDGDRWIIVASNAGSDRHPVWYLNLEARPEAEIVIDSHRVAVRARRAEDPERARIWQLVVAQQAAYAGYAARTPREIPLVVLQRR